MSHREAAKASDPDSLGLDLLDELQGKNIDC